MPESQKQLLRKKWKSWTSEQREEIANKANTSPAYLRQVMACGRKPGAVMAKNIELASGGDVPRQILRPDIFNDLSVTA